MAFVGPSGGGKSTLANLVCRFFDVQSGSVRVGGADVRDIPKEELMDTISFVFQNSRLLKGSILDNVRLGRPQATEAEVLAALKAAQCMDIIEKFPAGIHTVIGTKGVYLSGGEQQRIAIARAMLKNAPILILDEATAFADPDNEAKVQAAFARFCQGQNRADDRAPPVHRRQRRLHLCGAGWADCRIRHKGRTVRAERPVCPDVAGLSGLGAVEGRKGGVKDDRKIQHATASSPEGAKGLVKGVLACAFQNIAFMLPTGLLYLLVKDLLAGSAKRENRLYLLGCAACFALILLTTWFQYNGTYFTTYKESGTRRLTLCGSGCASCPCPFRQAGPCRPDQHHHGGLRGVGKDLLSLYSRPVRFLDLHRDYCAEPVCVRLADGTGSSVGHPGIRCHRGGQLPGAGQGAGQDHGGENGLCGRHSGVHRDPPGPESQQCGAALSVRPFKKIRAVENNPLRQSWKQRCSCPSAGMVLKLGIASVALTGSVLLVQGSIDVLTLFLFLMAASRMYDPMQGALQNLAAVIAMRTNVGRMNEILDAPCRPAASS